MDHNLVALQTKSYLVLETESLFIPFASKLPILDSVVIGLSHADR